MEVLFCLFFLCFFERKSDVKKTKVVQTLNPRQTSNLLPEYLSHGEALLLLRRDRIEWKDRGRGWNDRIMYWWQAPASHSHQSALPPSTRWPRGCSTNTAAPALKGDSSRAPAHSPNSPWGHWRSEAVWSMCKVARMLGTASLRSCCLTFRGGDRSNVSVQSSRGNTFLTSAILSFLEAGFSLVSGGVCWDLEPVDSLSDSDWLSEDSELLFDSLPCSLSDWLAESEPEASSDAEWLMVEKEEVTF